MQRALTTALVFALFVPALLADTDPPAVSFQICGVLHAGPPPSLLCPGDLNRWWNTDVVVTVTATDSDSGVASITCDGVTPPAASDTSPLTLTLSLPEGITNLQCRARDNAGNVSADSVLPIKIDKTGPEIVLTRSPAAPEPSGWNRIFVSVIATPSDALSGMGNFAGFKFETVRDGANQSVFFQFTDAAGNSSTAGMGGINVDTTPPALLANERFPAPNEFGWNREPVNVRFVAADATSGLTGSGVIEHRFENEVEGLIVEHTFTDVAGNSLTVRPAQPVSIDRTPPRFFNDFVCCPNSGSVDGWFANDATVHFFAVDDLSKLTTGLFEEVTSVITTEGQNVFERTFTDRAGNSTTYHRVVKIDKTPPIVTTGFSPAPNANGWNNSPVTLRWTARDDVSGIQESATQEFVLDFEISGERLGSRFFKDLAGNVAGAEISGVYLDLTPPTVTVNRSPAANANNWNNDDVSVRFEASDARSGIDGEASREFLFTESGGNQFAQHFFFDRAGNRAEGVIVGINIDKLPPVIVNVSQNPSRNSFGWNNSNVTVRFDVSDSPSGIANLNDMMFLTMDQEGADQTARRTFTDRAGNSTSAELGGISIDKTRPQVTATASPAANAYGWNNSDVTVQFAAGDSLSGMDGTTSGSVVFSTEGKNQTKESSELFRDRAGNTQRGVLGGISIDKTPPQVGCAGTPSLLWPPNRQLIPVTMQRFFFDGDVFPGSGGPANGIRLLSVVSSIPENGDIVGWDLGTEDESGELLAWRSNVLPVYTFMYQAEDFAGNSGACTAQVAVGRE